MTTVPLPQLKGSNLLTASRMQCFKTCPRLHYYRYELGLRPVESAKPLRMGAAIHLGIDSRARGKSTDAAIWDAIAGYEVVPAWAKEDDKLAEWLVERETVARLLAAYFWWWERAEVADALRVARVIESEGMFQMPIRNPDTGRATPRFLNAGKRDGLVELGDARMAVREAKSAGEDIGPDSVYWKRLKIDAQISNYYITAEDQGRPVATVLYDVIRKPTISPRQIPLLDKEGLKVVTDVATGERVMLANGKPRQSADVSKGWTLEHRRETDAEFGERLTADIAERPAFYFQRREIPRLADDLKEYREELWQIQSAIADAQRNGRWFRNTGACMIHGRDCEFLDVCGRRLEPGEVPEGFKRVNDIHPELQETA